MYSANISIIFSSSNCCRPISLIKLIDNSCTNYNQSQIKINERIDEVIDDKKSISFNIVDLANKTFSNYKEIGYLQLKNQMIIKLIGFEKEKTSKSQTPWLPISFLNENYDIGINKSNCKDSSNVVFQSHAANLLESTKKITWLLENGNILSNKKGLSQPVVWLFSGI